MISRLPQPPKRLSPGVTVEVPSLRKSGTGTAALNGALTLELMSVETGTLDLGTALTIDSMSVEAAAVVNGLQVHVSGELSGSGTIGADVVMMPGGIISPGSSDVPPPGLGGALPPPGLGGAGVTAVPEPGTLVLSLIRLSLTGLYLMRTRA